MPTSGCALAPRLSRRVGFRRAVLWHDEAAVEGVGSEQLQFHVREAGEDRFPSRFPVPFRPGSAGKRRAPAGTVGGRPAPSMGCLCRLRHVRRGLPVLRAPGPTVDLDRHPADGGARLDQLERQVRAGVGEQTPALADDHRVGEQGDLGGCRPSSRTPVSTTRGHDQ